MIKDTEVGLAEECKNSSSSCSWGVHVSVYLGTDPLNWYQLKQLHNKTL